MIARWIAPVLVVAASTAAAAAPPTGWPVGDVAYAEHFAFVRVGVAEGIGGPARHACKSSAWAFCAQDKEGNLFVAEPQNCVVHMITPDGQDFVIAGDGRKGFRDGPGPRARFDFGCGSYNDLQLHCDDAGNVYVGDGMNNRLRKLSRQPDGTWMVSTVSGGGTKRVKKGEWVAATDLQFGIATRFGVSPDGKAAYYCTYGGLYKVLLKENKATIVLTAEDIEAMAKTTGVLSWHVDGGTATTDGRYLWFPDSRRGGMLLSYDDKTQQVTALAGGGKAYDDADSALTAGYHTVFATHAMDGSVTYVGGGDEFACRRIHNGVSTHLMKDGTWKSQKGDAGSWLFGGSGLYLGRDNKLYTVPPPYSWPGWIVRATFKDGAAR